MRTTRFVAVMLMAVGLVGWAAAADTVPASTPKPLELKAGMVMPDFVLADQNGKQWKLSEQKGKRAVVVTFGYTMCACGKAALKDLQTIQDTYGPRGLQVVHVNMEPEIITAEPKYLAKFAKENKITYPLLSDKDLAVSSRFDFPGMPFLCLVDRDGVIRFTMAGHPEGYLKAVSEEVQKCLPPAGTATHDGLPKQ